MQILSVKIQFYIMMQALLRTKLIGILNKIYPKILLKQTYKGIIRDWRHSTGGKVLPLNVVNLCLIAAIPFGPLNITRSQELPLSIAECGPKQNYMKQNKSSLIYNFADLLLSFVTFIFKKGLIKNKYSFSSCIHTWLFFNVWYFL